MNPFHLPVVKVERALLVPQVGGPQVCPLPPPWKTPALGPAAQGSCGRDS